MTDSIFNSKNINAMISGPSSQDSKWTVTEMGTSHTNWPQPTVTDNTYIGYGYDKHDNVAHQTVSFPQATQHFVDSPAEYEFNKILESGGAVSIASLLQHGAISVLKLDRRGFTIVRDDRDHGEATPMKLLERQSGVRDLHYVNPNAFWETSILSRANQLSTTTTF